MGQKINPLGFRLGTTQSHHSIWFAHPKSYSEGLQEDKKIKNCIKNFVEKNIQISSGVEGIARITIQKGIDLINVIIYMGNKDLFSSQGIKELQNNLQKEINSVNLKLNLTITKVAKPYGQPNLLAAYLEEQLLERVPFRKAMKKAIELTEEADTKGIQIQIAGRIDGREMARVEWIREGRVPLQTIRAKIDYCSYTVRTIYGALGLKIWIFAGEE
uniref:ribosomal protein S3 n=1 Tax=Myosurus apetalus TaxID=2071495 RepID=UPI0030E1F61D|nr:ribosomal protein S3 [Myosurus minimus]